MRHAFLITIVGLAVVSSACMLPSSLFGEQKKSLDCRVQACDPLKVEEELFGPRSKGPYVPQAAPPPSGSSAKAASAQRVVILPVLFESGKVDILPAYYVEIEKVGKALVERPDKYLWIEGHTDSIGPDSANMKLSEERALSVKQHILTTFTQISAERIIVQGYGERRPITTNKSEEGRQRNRRIEFVNRE